ncbi:MAG TPA: FHA domain-containing protein [Acetobacteraceae bacterium]|nr:FHA domain-containing protein [Acetobacteraceae bacterium]
MGTENAAVQAQREIVGFLSAYQETWHRFFPDLHRRGQWHLVSHLCARARGGAPVGELSGMVKQVFLLDDATVRERLGELYRLGFCTVDPPDRPVSARTLVVPTQLLTAKFDGHLIETAARLLETALAGPPARPRHAPMQLESETRRKLLGAIEICDRAWVDALERVLESMGLSVARRMEARRHLLSPSHRLLTLLALRHRYGLPPQDDGEGLLADDMAAELLRLQRQNFQTTRDHIAALLQLGLLERRAGRALRVALAETAAAELDAGLTQIAEDLTRVAGSLSGAAEEERDVEATAISHTPIEPLATPVETARILVVAREGEAEQRVALGSEPLVIGRAPASGLMLSAHEVSRAHCRIEAVGDAVSITDLDSTNGTFVGGRRIVGAVALPKEVAVQVGPFRLHWEPTGNVEDTKKPPAAASGPARRRRAG